MSDLFWLHVKKSAGTSTRALLAPYYVEVDRGKRPGTFIQARPVEYNDILNNYRVVLGEYQFRRCLFARHFLYPDTWDSPVSFAFCREPLSRCVSMFHYLYWRSKNAPLLVKCAIARSVDTDRLHYSTSRAFDIFLDEVALARTSDANDWPLGLHFTTHTAAMWDDVTDETEKVLLRHIFRLEHLAQGLNVIFEECGIPKRIDPEVRRFNNARPANRYVPSRSQRHRVQELFAKDFDLYESASISTFDSRS